MWSARKEGGSGLLIFFILAIVGVKLKEKKSLLSRYRY